MKLARAALLGALLFLTLGAGKRPPGLGDVTDVRIFEHPGYTRVVVELSRPAPYQTGELGSPPRLFIDIDGIWIEPPQREPAGQRPSSALRRVRGGQNTLTRARVVLELGRAGRQQRTFHLQDPFRIVTDLYDSEARPSARPSPPPVAAFPRDGPRTFDQRPVRRIAIDPGHGGKDPGAVGHRGLREKDVVLRVARELEKLVDQQGFDAFLTRSRDVYLTLEQRTQLANQRDADLFVSIHANASPNRGSHGVETYLLDTRYDRQTARVAARENGTSVDQLNDLQRILASLRLGYTERFAARLAGKVQKSLIRGLRSQHGGTRDLGVKRGPFLVLFMADMPAVLVELGFVSNRGEAGRLRSKGYARAAARGLAQGIAQHRDEHARSLVATR